MLMSGPPPDRSINHVGDKLSALGVPNHAVPSEYKLYQGPLHAHQYRQQQALVPTFQNVIANWLKNGKQF